ncbi:uncharacterized protein UTRI_06582_B [Ustilago trichophora]|uniref:D-isomer specific 2-hydroxyacid dehydrogenase NAD-binding domain-containing protein n=1 Tax=Ustilago trichophora TaxID=86804 RepID=A0A5C3EMJ9_9BASI|nr:uncharacterized protein UTRI_06582_B [Ustilago trichophora]
MVNVTFQPADPSRCCLNIPFLLSTLPQPLIASLDIQPCVTLQTTALFWLPNLIQGNTSSELRQILLNQGKNISFIQLPMTGVDDFIPLMKEGCYAQPVAEHALSLILILLRGLHLDPPPTSSHCDTLFNKRVLIIGNGSISLSLRTLLSPFKCSITVLDSTSSLNDLQMGFKSAQLIILACPLTNRTHNLINNENLKCIRTDAMLINVARGEIVQTTALLDALQNGRLKNAALDVIAYSSFSSNPNDEDKQKEIVQRLVKEGKLILTPHSAIPSHLIHQLLSQRIGENLHRLIKGKDEFVGLVDAEKGY